MLPAECLPQPPQTLLDNTMVTDLAVFPAPSPLDPWHVAHVRMCAHASAACAACSVAFICCSCRALRFTPGTAPIVSQPASQQPGLPQRSRSASPALFRLDIGNGTPPPGFDSHCDDYNDDAYAQALADSDTCDNSSCPRGTDEPATYTIVVEKFDEGSEEFYNATYRACAACNRACKRSFLSNKIKSRQFDNSTRGTVEARRTTGQESPLLMSPMVATKGKPAPSDVITALQDSLRVLNSRPPTPAAFVAIIRVKHDALCQHLVDTCPTCSLGLTCCLCKAVFAPAAAQHLACADCKHVAGTCCSTAFCCKCSKIWSPIDSVAPLQLLARRFYGGAGSNSSPEPDIWTPSPRSSPDEIDDLTARANIPLPTSRSESDTSCAPSRASSVDVPVNVAATPLPTPDFSSLPDDLIDGFVHPSFPDRAIVDSKDKRHFLG